MQKSKDARRKFYKFSVPGYVPKRALSVAQLAMAGVAAIYLAPICAQSR